MPPMRIAASGDLGAGIDKVTTNLQKDPMFLQQHSQWIQGDRLEQRDRGSGETGGSYSSHGGGGATGRERGGCTGKLRQGEWFKATASSLGCGVRRQDEGLDHPRGSAHSFTHAHLQTASLPVHVPLFPPLPLPHLCTPHLTRPPTSRRRSQQNPPTDARGFLGAPSRCQLLPEAAARADHDSYSYRLLSISSGSR